MSVDSVRISLIVPTIRRVDQLRRLLASLARQTHANFHVLLADQNPPGMLDALVGEFSSAMAIERRLVPARGVSAARNAMLDLADGEIVAFPDDDCHYEPETLATVARLFGDHPEYGIIMGSWYRTPAEAPTLSRTHAFVTPETRFSVFHRGETYVQFYRREAVEAIGLFDVELGPGTGLPYGCGEDTDYVLRGLELGSRVGRAQAIRVYHDPTDVTSPATVARAVVYGRGRIRLLQKHGFPWWFVAMNVLYPLTRLPFEGRRACHYRWSMFRGRLIQAWRKNVYPYSPPP